MTRSKRVKENQVNASHIVLERKLRFLSASQISMIDNVLKDVSPYGEVKLRVEKGKLSFVAQTKSYDAFKLQKPEGMQEIGNTSGK